MTEICSKGDSKFPEGIKGLANNSDTEGTGMFDALFGMVSSDNEEVEIDQEISLIPTNLNITTSDFAEKVQNPEISTTMVGNFHDPNGNPSNKVTDPPIIRSNWTPPNTTASMGSFSLVLKLTSTDNKTDFLQKLAAVVKENSETVSFHAKDTILEQKNQKTVPMSSQILKEFQSINKEVKPSTIEKSIDNMVKKAYQGNESLSDTLRITQIKEKSEMLNLEPKQLVEKSSDKGFQLPKFFQTSSGKEILKADTGPNASITASNSNSNSSMSNNSNSGSQLNSGSATQANSSTVLDHLNMLDRSWSKNLLNRVQQALQNGKESIELALKPKNLGKLTISLSLHNDAAKISIITETSSAALLLAESEAKLSQMLEGSGLKLSNLNTNSDHEKKGTHDQNNNEKGQKDKPSEDKEADQEDLPSGSNTIQSLNQTINLIA